MVYRLSEYLTGLLIEVGSIEKKDKNLYRYGIEIIMVMALNIVTVIIIGYAMGMFLECVIFLLLFIPLRSYAGGYHNSSSIKCYFLSCFIIISSLIGMKHICVEVKHFYVFVIICIPCLYIWKVAPIENINKPMSAEELKKNRQRTRILVLVYLIFGNLAFIFASYQIAKTVNVVLWITMILMVIDLINKPET